MLIVVIIIIKQVIEKKLLSKTTYCASFKYMTLMIRYKLGIRERDWYITDVGDEPITLW
jgi:hypothetical protein